MACLIKLYLNDICLNSKNQKQDLKIDLNRILRPPRALNITDDHLIKPKRYCTICLRVILSLDNQLCLGTLKGGHLSTK